MARFRILTFVTDHDLYAGMRDSFEDAGFVEPAARYQIVDNSVSNAADPYQLVNSILHEMTEAYLIVCHQDIRLEDGATIASLGLQLERSDQMYPSWGVLGVA